VLYDLITYAGAAYLAWLGFKALRSKGSGQFEQKNAQSSYFTALFSQFISAEQLISDKMIMVTTVTLIDLVWFMSVAVVLSQPRVIKTLREKSKTMDKISGVVMIGLALRVIV
jgi:threonine/homoserine/homoserine lactone efflux protein